MNGDEGDGDCIMEVTMQFDDAEVDRRSAIEGVMSRSQTWVLGKHLQADNSQNWRVLRPDITPQISGLVQEKHRAIWIDESTEVEHYQRILNWQPKKPAN